MTSPNSKIIVSRFRGKLKTASLPFQGYLVTPYTELEKCMFRDSCLFPSKARARKPNKKIKKMFRDSFLFPSKSRARKQKNKNKK
jgi:hypothetical protein